MNTINNKFSFSRLGAVLKRDIVVNRWPYLFTFFTFFAAFLVYQIFDMKDVVELSMLRALPVEEYMKRLASDCVPFFYGILALALVCAASEMCGTPLKTKGRGINYLMMPATNLEKFLSRALIVTVMLIVMAYVALFCADLARMLYASIVDAEGFYGFTVPCVLAEFGETFPSFYRTGGEVWGLTADGTVRMIGFNAFYGVVNVTAMVLFFLFMHSLYILGGCIWRKAAIVKTLIVQMVVSAAIAWVFVKLEPFVLPWLNDVFISFFETEQQAGMTLVSIAVPVLLALTTLNWWLSYRLFSRKQVVAPQHHHGGRHLHEMLGKK